jgi:general secretion pathway protein G
VELLVVMLIITVLAAIVLRLVQNASQQSKVTQCRTQMRAIIMALDAYRQETGNLPPLNNGGYILTDRLYSGPRKYLRPQDLRDPWGHDFVCKGVGATLHQWGALYAPLIRSLGPDGKADTADDLAAGERQ